VPGGNLPGGGPERGLSEWPALRSLRPPTRLLSNRLTTARTQPSVVNANMMSIVDRVSRNVNTTEGYNIVTVE
jgi:hypothetical protein